jgi:membrane fusion protein (multidrug efflux system)
MPDKKILIIVGALIIGLLAYFKFQHPQNSAAQMPQGAMEVNVITIKKQQATPTIELPARIASYKTSEVRPQIDGVIKKRLFIEGSLVKEGESLYQIDPSFYEAAYIAARENLKSVQAKKDRYDNLLELEAVSKQEYDDMLATLTTAKSEYKKAKTNFDYTKVLAPISGYIGKSNIAEGMLVTANQTNILTTITQLDELYADMVQPSKDAIKMQNQKNISVSIKVDGVVYDKIGTLKFSEVFVEKSTDSVRLRAKISNKDRVLLPGMFATAILHLKSFETITVPQRSTTRAPNGSLTVWIVDKDNVAKLVPIKASEAINDKWIVVEGLNDGDVIIYEGFQKIMEGAKVKPVLMQVEDKN